jgi:hypothetical protein
MAEFLRNGKKQLGQKVVGDLARAMHDDYRQNFLDQILVVGWGKSPLSVTLFSISSAGDGMHGKDGMAVIGSGGHAALSTLFLLGHGLGSSLADAIYAVAAAKFSSEDHGIGKDTRIWIGRKRQASDDHSQVPGILLDSDDIEQLRRIWERHGKPRIPSEASAVVEGITTRIGDEEVKNREATLKLTKAFGQINAALSG